MATDRVAPGIDWLRPRNGPPFVIAEAGVNHNGSIDRAIEMVRVAHAIGADAVKFQTFKAAALATRSAPKAAYQSAATGDEDGQWEMLHRLELSDDEFRRLRTVCDEIGITFMSTPFDIASLRFLAEDIAVDCLKLGSGELTNGPLLHAAASSGRPLILSTGMANLAEIEDALGVVAHGLSGTSTAPGSAAFAEAFASDDGQRLLRSKVVLLHCTTAYPAPAESLNLQAIGTIRNRFGLAVGYSDHSLGLSASVAATALGSCLIEKHFTLDRGLPGPDHAASLEPREMEELVAAVRQTAVALGSGEKIPAAVERENIHVARKSLVAARRLSKGHRLEPADIDIKRPAAGKSPMTYWDVLGTPADRDIEPDEPI